MAKPSSVTLSKKDQKSVLSMYKKESKSARSISDSLHLSRHQVMLFLESQGLATYSDGSYC